MSKLDNSITFNQEWVKNMLKTKLALAALLSVCISMSYAGTPFGVNIKAGMNQLICKATEPKTYNVKCWVATKPGYQITQGDVNVSLSLYDLQPKYLNTTVSEVSWTNVTPTMVNGTPTLNFTYITSPDLVTGKSTPSVTVYCKYQDAQS